MGLFSQKEIKTARYLGVRTGEETRILATYNFSIYTFFVEYTDGSSETIQLSPDSRPRDKKLFNDLMRIANQQENSRKTVIANNETSSNKTTSDRSPSNIYEDLKSIKELFDSGILTEDQFESQKQKLLAELNLQKDSEQIQEATEATLYISRYKKRPMGEAQTIVYIDGAAHKEYNLDQDICIKLNHGTHTIQFKRAAIKSDLIEQYFSIGTYHITFDAKAFSIKATIDR